MEDYQTTELAVAIPVYTGLLICVNGNSDTLRKKYKVELRCGHSLFVGGEKKDGMKGDPSGQYSKAIGL